MQIDGGEGKEHAVHKWQAAETDGISKGSNIISLRSILVAELTDRRCMAIVDQSWPQLTGADRKVHRLTDF